MDDHFDTGCAEGEEVVDGVPGLVSALPIAVLYRPLVNVSTRLRFRADKENPGTEPDASSTVGLRLLRDAGLR